MYVMQADEERCWKLTGIGVADDICLCAVTDAFNEWTHFCRTEGTVQAQTTHHMALYYIANPHVHKILYYRVHCLTAFHFTHVNRSHVSSHQQTAATIHHWQWAALHNAVCHVCLLTAAFVWRHFKITELKCQR